MYEYLKELCGDDEENDQCESLTEICDENLESVVNLTDNFVNTNDALESLDIVFSSPTVPAPPHDFVNTNDALESLDIVFSSPTFIETVSPSRNETMSTVLISILEELKSIKASVENVEIKVEKLDAVVVAIDQTIKRKHEKQKQRASSNNSQSSNTTFTELLKSSINCDDFQYEQEFIEEIVRPEVNNLDNDNDDEYSALLNQNKRCQTNKCASYIKSEMTHVYTEEELSNGRLVGTKRKYKTAAQETSALSPGWLKAILYNAKRTYWEEFKNIDNMNEVINSKCRQVKLRMNKVLDIWFSLYFLKYFSTDTD